MKQILANCCLYFALDVGFHIGGSSRIEYLVMQIHYARTIGKNEPDDHSGLAIYKTKNVPKYTQGIFLLLSGSGIIPPNRKRECQTTFSYDALGL